jgi:hypothetical protein
MDEGKKNIYQTLSFEIWMEERKTYKTFSFEIWMEERKTKHIHISNDNVWYMFFFPSSISQMKIFGICFSFLHPYLK